METWEEQKGEAIAPIQVDIAMYGGPRAGKTSLLASMYSTVRGEVRKAGLGIRRRGAETMRALDNAEDELMRLPGLVKQDPTLLGVGVHTTPPGEVRTFDFILHGEKVDVARLRFYDFSGEDIAAHADIVKKGLKEAEIILIAINTPAMMVASEKTEFDMLHTRANVPDQLDGLLEDWSGKAPQLVMFCPIKCERWIEDQADSQVLLEAVREMYKTTFNILERDKFKETTVVITPVETVGSVIYDGYQLYNPSLPPSYKNVVYRWRGGTSMAWAPRYHEQPFRWALLAVTRAVDYGTIMRGKGGNLWQKLTARAGKWFIERPWYVPKMRALKEFWEDQSGLTVFKKASKQLSDGRKLDPPCALVREGALMRPIEK